MNIDIKSNQYEQMYSPGKSLELLSYFILPGKQEICEAIYWNLQT